jgi:predicted aspartyl protease
MKRVAPTLRAKKFHVAFLTAVACLGSMNIAHADGNCKYVKLATLPLDLSDMVPAVQGSVNSNATSMLVDSGTASTLLTQVEKMRLGLSSDAPNPAHKHSKAGDDEMTTLTELSIGPIELGATHVLTSPSLTDHANYGSVVGADFLFQHDMEISLRDKQINFFKPDHCDGKTLSYWDANAITVPLDSISATDHRQMITVEINGQKLRALIDTGTPISVMHLSAAARLGITPQSAGVTKITPKNASANTPSKAWLAPFSQFTIGDETIKNVKIPITNLRDANSTGTTPDILLGADFLNAHHMLFAVSQHQLYFSYLGGSVFGADVAPSVAQK